MTYVKREKKRNFWVTFLIIIGPSIIPLAIASFALYSHYNPKDEMTVSAKFDETSFYKEMYYSVIKERPRDRQDSFNIGYTCALCKFKYKDLDLNGKKNCDNLLKLNTKELRQLDKDRKK